jgi:hypothetical protein
MTENKIHCTADFTHPCQLPPADYTLLLLILIFAACTNKALVVSLNIQQNFLYNNFRADLNDVSNLSDQRTFQKIVFCIYSIPCYFPGNYKFTNKPKLFIVAEQLKKRAAYPKRESNC